MNSISIHPDANLGVVSLTVSNIQRAHKFYTHTLGFQTLNDHAGTVILGVDGATCLVELKENPGAQPKPQRSTGLYHFAVLLPSRSDLARSLHRLSERRYPLHGASDHGVSEALYLADPDGNGIEIYVDRKRQEWPWQDGQLQMVTAPLDLDDLLKQSDASGAALPSETRIGHVHLHVADLSAGEGFYRHVLGFDLVQRYGPSASFLSAGGYHHHIGLNTWAGVGAPSAPVGSAGLRYFTINLPDRNELTRMVEHLHEAGVPSERLADDAVYLHDPSSNGILLSAQESC